MIRQDRLPPLAILSAALAWVGRQGTRATAAIVFIAIALPPVDAVLKPYVTEAIFALLAIAFLRLDLAFLRQQLRRPVIALAATAWTMAAVPAAIGAASLAVGLEARSPDLALALMLQAVASPMMAAPAFAALMGLDATLVLITLVASSVLAPFTAPVFAYAFTGSALSLSPIALGAKLLAILAGAALVGQAARWFAGSAVIAQYRAEIDGLNIFVVFIFVAAVMENVAARFLARPLLMLALMMLAFLVFLTILGVTVLVFAIAGRKRALAIGFMTAQRNMGLMVAATGGVLPDIAWLYFALSQFPIYLSPLLLKPLVAKRGVRVRVGGPRE
jgi:BASS family bile acid:Na+ symporter